VSLNPEQFRRACAHFATGVAILTTRSAEGAPHGLTINSFTSLSLDPPLVMAAIAHSSAQLQTFDTSTSFAVNVLHEAQRDLSVHFAKVNQDRFNGVPWTEGTSGAPLLEGAIAVIECRVVHRIDVGDHRVIIGEAVDAQMHGGRPLLFFQSGYAALG
jgi:flavin reductase (DIM6/NTAB) family NADH-FMN oxidoreductase RutF